jgi:thiosulfate dehydrogenase (quinone) large subunit
MFLNAASAEVGNPNFVTTHVMPVLSHQGVFHPVFAILASPELAPAIAFLVSYGHLLIGLSLAVGLLVRVSGGFAVALMLLYWLAAIDPPDVNAVTSSIGGYVRIVRYVAGVVGNDHILYAVVLVFQIAMRAGHVWGLDGWIAKLPFVARHRGLRALTA